MQSNNSSGFETQLKIPIPTITLNSCDDTIEDVPKRNDFGRKNYNRDPRSPLSELLRIFYMITKYFALSSISLYREDNPEFQKGSFYFFKKSGCVFQVLVITTQIWSITSYLLSSTYFNQRSAFNTWHEASQVGHILHIFLTTFWFLTITNFYKSFAKGGEGFSAILNRIDGISRRLKALQDDNEPNSPKSTLSQVKSKILETILNGLPLVLVIIIFVWACYTQYLNMQGPYNVSVGVLLRQQVCGLPIENCHEDTELSGLPVVYIILTVFLTVGCTMAEVAAHLWEVAPLFHAIVFWFIVRDFKLYLKQEENKTDSLTLERRNDALQIFEDICLLSDQMDATVGSIIALTSLGVVSYYANLINEVSRVMCVVLGQVGIYALIQGLFFLLAAEANAKLSYFVLWLQKSSEAKLECERSPSQSSLSCFPKEREVQKQRICLALNLLERNQIGIRGRVFTVTYGFVGNMLSLLLTYAILISENDGIWV